MNNETLIEFIAVLLNVIYLILLIREKKACWYFGIIGSLLSIFLFYKLKLYSESILYIYYVIIGFYGLLKWSNVDNQYENFRISFLSKKELITSVIGGVILSVILAYVFRSYTDASSPVLDAFTTVFSFIASYFEANKKINSWIFWMVINTLTLYLYATKGLYIYGVLTVVYLVFSFIGYSKWKAHVLEYK